MAFPPPGPGPGPLMGPPPGPMPGAAPPPPAAPPLGPPASGLTPGAVPPAVLAPFTNLSSAYSHEEQLLDVATRMLQTIIDTGGYIDDPPRRAQVLAIYQQCKRIQDSHESAGGGYGTAPERDREAAPSATVELQPAGGGDNEGESMREGV